jgi:hypothetical protein
LFEAGELIPIQTSEDGEQGRRAAAVHFGEPSAQGPQEEARGSVGRNLRWAFPLPDSGSFAGLLDELDEV